MLQDEGWNCHQFHAGTEFFSDFGVYDVIADVSLTAGSSAPPVSSASRAGNGGGMTTHRYYQEDVHDFAWTTSPDYLERTARFEHATLPRCRDAPAPPAGARGAGRAPLRRDADDASKCYGEWFGAYPYGHVTIVDPAWQSGAGGMEYPTLFTAGTRWLAPSHVTTPEEVTVHEAGHQFWVRHRRQQRIRRRLDGRRLQPVLNSASGRAGMSRTIWRCGISADSSRGCSGHRAPA